MIRYRIRSFWARTREASVREKVVVENRLQKFQRQLF
jgi:hypothetical protein